MAQPKRYGHRVGVLAMMTTDDRLELKARAAKAGLTMNDYVLELIRRDDLDTDGRPVWADSVERGAQLELSA